MLSRQTLKRKSEASLSHYASQAWSVLEPGRSYIHNWHIDLICEFLTSVSAGRFKRLLITLPPRHMKSLLVSVLWPTWSWITRPESRWIFASYAANLSIKSSLDRRALINSQWYQNFWRDRLTLTDDQNEKAEFTNSRRGIMFSTSVAGSATGRGGDFIVVDDLHNPLQTESDAQRDEAIRFFDQTLMTRLDDPAQGAIVAVMHRLHERDLAGQLIERGGWEVLRLPAEAEARERVTFPISGRVVERQPGDLLWPRRFPREVLAEQKRALGSYAYAGQYQQRPSPADGGIIKRNWWRYYREVPTKFDTMIQSWDCSFKATETSDFVVGQVWGKIGAKKYLLDQVRGRFSFTRTKAALEDLTAKWPKAFAKLIEEKANGLAVIDSLRAVVPGLIAISPQGSKLARAHSITPDIEAGDVYLPDPTLAPWVNDFVEECCAFPNGANDDQLDAATQAIHYLRGQTKRVPCIVRPGLFIGEGELDGEDLWRKVYAGMPLTNDEITRLK